MATRGEGRFQYQTNEAAAAAKRIASATSHRLNFMSRFQLAGGSRFVHRRLRFSFEIQELVEAKQYLAKIRERGFSLSTGFACDKWQGIGEFF